MHAGPTDLSLCGKPLPIIGSNASSLFECLNYSCGTSLGIFSPLGNTKLS
jgi:hypothetical protein